MSTALLESTAGVVQEALADYDDDDAALEVLNTCARRLHEPLRLALAGMVKAGKSTLLNALIGEQIAPTDAGECTRTITWYRYSDTPRVHVHPRDGGPVKRMPIRRDHGRLVLDFPGLKAEDVSWIDVEWPSTSLRSTILIDTPGIASASTATSARSTVFLTPDSAPSAADAVIYLLRHVHASDVGFLEAFRDTAAGATQTVNALAVLSRADEVGSGRVDSLLSAARIAERYRTDGELRSLALDIMPVAGLLAESARTLREAEFAAFRELATLDRADRDRMLVSVDRFTAPTGLVGLPPAERRALIDRFGIFGVRLGALLVRGGAGTSSVLAERLLQQSGLAGVQSFVDTHFRARSDVLKVRGVLHAVEELVRQKPRGGSRLLLSRIEQIGASTHALREMALLARARTGTLPLPANEAEEAERLVGGSGTTWAQRLGMPESAHPSEAQVLLNDLLRRWHTRAQSPFSERDTVTVCRTVIRSVEEVASEVRTATRPEWASTDVDAGGAPAQDGGQQRDQQAENAQAEGQRAGLAE